MPRARLRPLRSPAAMIRLGGVVLALFGALACAPRESVRLAVIGDFGGDTAAEAQVAALVRGFQPDLIATVGDNNYPDGAAETIDRNIGRHYHDYIAPYRGSFGAGASVNRFFPALGNHDWRTAGAKPYLDYFELPGQRALLHRSAWAGRALRRRQRPARARRRQRRLGPGALAARGARRLGRAAPLRAVPPPAVLVRPARLDLRAAVAVPRMGRDRGALAATTTATSASRPAACRTWWWARAVRICTSRSRPCPAASSASSARYGALRIDVDADGGRAEFASASDGARDTFALRPARELAPPRALVGSGDTWKLVDGKTVTGRWLEPGFDTTAWAAAPTPFRLVDAGAARARAHTTYYRREFELDAAPAAFARAVARPAARPARGGLAQRARGRPGRALEARARVAGAARPARGPDRGRRS